MGAHPKDDDHLPGSGEADIDYAGDLTRRRRRPGPPMLVMAATRCWLGPRSGHAAMGLLPRPRVCALVAALLFSGGPALLGQTAEVHAVYVAGRLGANLERTDPGAGTSVGAGGSFGFFFTERWAVEMEAWIPAYIADQACAPR